VQFFSVVEDLGDLFRPLPQPQLALRCEQYDTPTPGCPFEPSLPSVAGTAVPPSSIPYAGGAEFSRGATINGPRPRSANYEVCAPALAGVLSKASPATSALRRVTVYLAAIRSWNDWMHTQSACAWLRSKPRR